MSSAEVAELDERLFIGPFVLVGVDNRSIRTARYIEVARAALARQDEVATIVATLVDDAWAVDIDPADVGAAPEAGEAAAENVAAWCEQLGVAHLVRASGRPGGRHVVAVVPEAILPEFRDVARRAAEQHGVPATVRKSLRLIGAPHRLGFAAEVISSTLRAEYLPERPTKRRRRDGKSQVPDSRADRRRRGRGSGPGGGRVGRGPRPTCPSRRPRRWANRTGDGGSGVSR